MREKIYYACGGILLVISAVLLINAGMIPRRITNSVSAVDIDKSILIEELNEIYDISYAVSKIKPDYMVSYVPKYEPDLYEDADFYAALFGAEDVIRDDGDYIVFGGGGKTLSINIDFNYLHYESSSVDSAKTEPLSPLSVIEEAKKFIGEKFLQLNYTESRVTSEGGGYTIVFLSKLDGVKNYAFPAVIQLDLYGNVKELDYYSFEYDKLGAAAVKTMKEAFYDLPVDEYRDMKIDLKSCELVYFYENSIVQPAYLFQGEIAGGRGFKCFVKASKY